MSTPLTVFNKHVHIDNETPPQFIDVVYTWVNCEDPRWVAKYNSVSSVIQRDRHCHFGEIYFSLKSVEAFAGDIVRRVFLVTDNQKLNDTILSPWLRKRLQYIDHADIIPQVYLPTFNSMTIESFLHNIKELSNVFIYLNDDMHFGNKVSMRDLFDEKTGVPIFYYKPMLVKPVISQKSMDWGLNAMNVFESYTNGKISVDLRSNHNAIVLRKDMCAMTWSMFGDHLAKSQQSKFRENYNVNFWFLSLFVGALLGKFVLKLSTPEIAITVYCDDEFPAHLDKLKNIRPKFMCINNLQERCKSDWERFTTTYGLARL
jgi:hypothetical protein